MTTQRQNLHAPTWVQWIGQAVSFLLLCGSALAALVLIIVPLLTGSQTYSVLTSSMAPAYPPGTFLVVKPTVVDTLRVGDVITYQIDSGQPDVITHRITGFSAGQDGERLLITQGDNNDVADPNPVMEMQVRGELFYAVPYVGFLANALGQTDRGGLTTAAAIVMIGFGIVTTAHGALAKRDRVRGQSSASETEQPVAVQS